MPINDHDNRPSCTPISTRRVRAEDLPWIDKQTRELEAFRDEQIARDGQMYDPILKEIVVYQRRKANQ